MCVLSVMLSSSVMCSLFLACVEATEEVSLDSPERQPILSDGPSPAITPVTPTVMMNPRVDAAVFDRLMEEVNEISQHYFILRHSLCSHFLLYL